jgi:ABC-type bacteriocin/lantibiotic exporter with double-glycine peptidase domain
MSRAKIWLIAACAALAACSAPARRTVEADKVRLEVPFYADDGDRGGPATLASILSFWDRPVEPRYLRIGANPSRLKGTLPLDLMLAAQDRGMQARSFQARVDDVKNELRLGHPVMAYVELGSRWLPRGRFVVITGFDDGRGGYFVHAGRYAHRFVEYRRFMTSWEKTGRWAILVMPAGERTISDRAEVTP